MKLTLKIFLVIFSLVWLSYFKADAQYIIAGQHDTSDYYSLKPDNLFIEGYNPVNYSIDINGDGVMDYTFTSLADEEENFSTIYCYITGTSGGQLISGAANICSAYITPTYSLTTSFEVGDTIDGNFAWQNSPFYAGYDFYWGPGYGGGTSGSCRAEFNKTDTAFIGIRIFSGAETLYGWIRMAGYLNVIDYACNKVVNTTGIYNLSKVYNIQVYPNPSKGIFTVNINGVTGNVNLSVYNVLGQIICSKSFNSTGTSSIDLSNQPSGIYFYKMISIEGYLLSNGKLVVE